MPGVDPPACPAAVPASHTSRSLSSTDPAHAGPVARSGPAPSRPQCRAPLPIDDAQASHPRRGDAPSPPPLLRPGTFPLDAHVLASDTRRLCTKDERLGPGARRLNPLLNRGTLRLTLQNAPVKTSTYTHIFTRDVFKGQTQRSDQHEQAENRPKQAGIALHARGRCVPRSRLHENRDLRAETGRRRNHA